MNRLIWFKSKLERFKKIFVKRLDRKGKRVVTLCNNKGKNKQTNKQTNNQLLNKNKMETLAQKLENSFVLFCENTNEVLYVGTHYECLGKFQRHCGFSFDNHKKYSYTTYNITSYSELDEWLQMIAFETYELQTVNEFNWFVTQDGKVKNYDGKILPEKISPINDTEISYHFCVTDKYNEVIGMFYNFKNAAKFVISLHQ